jgi:6-phosphofructokinase 2
MILDASGPPLAAAIEEGVYLIKPNLHELGDLVGSRLADRAAWEEAGRRLVMTGKVEIVALSLGHRGALLVTRDERWRAQPIPITPVSAVGAGDSFLGAMMWRLAAGDDLHDAFRYGVAAGAAALRNPGTELCHPKDVARLAAQVTLERA